MVELHKGTSCQSDVFMGLWSTSSPLDKEDASTERVRLAPVKVESVGLWSTESRLSRQEDNAWKRNSIPCNDSSDFGSSWHYTFQGQGFFCHPCDLSSINFGKGVGSSLVSSMSWWCPSLLKIQQEWLPHHMDEDGGMHWRQLAMMRELMYIREFGPRISCFNWRCDSIGSFQWKWHPHCTAVCSCHTCWCSFSNFLSVVSIKHFLHSI